MIRLLGTLVLLAGPGPDYSPTSAAWNGLDYLPTTASEAKVALSVLSELDFGAVRREDVLVFLVPGTSMDPGELVDFVLDGGHAIVALDVGQDDALARAFGVRLLDEPVVHDSYHRDHPGFPLLRRPGGAGDDEVSGRRDPADGGVHFLWFNVAEVILNHPGALAPDLSARGRGEPEVLLPFAEPGQAFAIEVRRGRGQILFLSDSSIFINDMQRHAYGDKQFVANLMRYYCEGEHCSAKVVLPGARVTGRYGPPSFEGLRDLEEVAARAIEELNALAPPAGEWMSREPHLPLLSLVALGLLVLGLSVLPWPRRPSRLAWEGRVRYRPTHVDYWVAALSTARASADFGAAAWALAGRLRRELAALETGNGDDEASVRAVERLAGAEAGAAASRALAIIDAVLPQRAGEPHRQRRISAAMFMELWEDCRRVRSGLRRSGL